MSDKPRFEAEPFGNDPKAKLWFVRDNKKESFCTFHLDERTAREFANAREMAEMWRKFGEACGICVVCGLVVGKKGHAKSCKLAALLDRLEGGG